MLYKTRQNPQSGNFTHKLNAINPSILLLYTANGKPNPGLAITRKPNKTSPFFDYRQFHGGLWYASSVIFRSLEVVPTDCSQGAETMSPGTNSRFSSKTVRNLPPQ